MVSARLLVCVIAHCDFLKTSVEYCGACFYYIACFYVENKASFSEDSRLLSMLPVLNAYFAVDSFFFLRYV